MNIEKLENNIQLLVANLNEESFIYDLLLAYEQPKPSITRLQKGDYNLSKVPGEILWKKKLFFKKEADIDLHGLIDKLKNDPAIIKHHPRFIIVTDFKTLLSVDTRTDDTLDIPVQDLAKHYDFYLPWVGMEKSQFQSENPADIKAAERMGRLYDLILADNPATDDSDRHALNIFFSRLLFCFFAEDTGIFADDQFTNAVASYTVEDGSDLQVYLQKLFKVLSLLERSGFPQFIQDFPYVNGGLFADEYPVPTFTAKSRKIIVECGALNWKAINPDIFGSMIQAVVHHSQRGNLGMHYTSVVNIMKVIEPLFLHDLYDELEQAVNNKKKLSKLLDRLYHLRIFDPACGSGNFLIIAYKELSKLEIEIFKRLYGRQTSLQFKSNISLTQFYGIELDDFAHETAKLSLWLAEHQMNLAFKDVFGAARPTLPLQDGGNIVCGNSTRLDWEEVCPNDEGYEIYILGNPPYLGFSMQSKDQKNDMKHVFHSRSDYKRLDYIACWFWLAANYIKNVHAEFAFVSTNSITQGEQVSLLWPHVFEIELEIRFAHQSFKWTNNAKGNAGVTCVVVGVRNPTEKTKWLFTGDVRQSVKNISPYLTSGGNLVVSKRSSSTISKIPEMLRGDMPIDGGNLILSEDEKDRLIEEYPDATRFIRKFIGASEFMKSTYRWCLWLKGNYNEAVKIQPIRKRVDAVKKMRLESQNKSTQLFAETPYLFGQIRHLERPSIIVPRTTSERRTYIPLDFIDETTIISDLASSIPYDSNHIFAVISSRIHMTWVRAVAGRLKTDYRYSSGLCYNTFPFPEITKVQKNNLENHVFKVLEEREHHSEKTMADDEVLDTDKKTILHIPNVNAGESTKDKHKEVDTILDIIGTVTHQDAETGVIFVERRSDGKIIKVADLVNDTPKDRDKIISYLRQMENVDDMDLIIALGMAKEGFDWPFCEHVLTVGYRGSLTEIIQIIGRATRDSSNKTHSQFTNLIVQPDAANDEVKVSVNNMLKAITASLLMEQVLAPNFKFKTRRFDDEEHEEGTIKIRGFKMPSSQRVKDIVESDLNDLKAAILQDDKLLQALPGEFIDPEVINKVMIPKIIQTKYPELSDEEIEEIRQHVVADSVIKNSEIKVVGDKSFVRMAGKFVNIEELHIDLIDSVNPFQKAFEVLSKSVTAKLLKVIQETIDAGRIQMTDEEAVILYRDKIGSFIKTHGREPNINSTDPLERRQAEALVYLRNKKRQMASENSND